MRLVARISTLAAAASSALLVAATASAQHGGGESGESGIDVVPPALWTAAGVAGGAVIFGTLYLLKKQMGGFPEHPEWVAPIEAIHSRTLPSEMPESDTDSHGGHGATHH